MPAFLDLPALRTLSQVLIGGIWIYHGLYSKLLNGIPRHQQIVARVLGQNFARPATRLIGVLELILGIWAITGIESFACAIVQTAAILGMNTLEIIFAGDLLISAIGMVALNLGFLALVWFWSLTKSSG
jgi:hypothetical protein